MVQKVDEARESRRRLRKVFHAMNHSLIMVLRVMSVLVCLYFRLETLREEEWDSDVTVVSSDMREWDAPELV